MKAYPGQALDSARYIASIHRFIFTNLFPNVEIIIVHRERHRRAIAKRIFLYPKAEKESHCHL